MGWWADQDPIEELGYGALNYFGAEAPHNPEPSAGRHCHTCEMCAERAYDRRWRSGSGVVPVQADGQEGIGGRQVGGYTGCQPDACIFDETISIEDTYVAAVWYDGGAMASYAVHFFAPDEEYPSAINGTQGRLEAQDYHLVRTPFPTPSQSIEWLPLFGLKTSIWSQAAIGNHQGRDAAFLEDLYLEDATSSVNRRFNARTGAIAVVTRLALLDSVRPRRPVNVGQMLEKG